MLVNKKKNKLKKKFVSLALGTALICTAGVTHAINVASDKALLDGSKLTNKTDMFHGTELSGYNGALITTNTGANILVRGYAKKVGLIADTVVADTGWLSPGQTSIKTFTQQADKYFYGQIDGQVIGAKGVTEIRVIKD
jgi:hypothetical protein